MISEPESGATIYCEGAFGTTDAKSGHGLVRRSARYRILSVVDSRHTGGDAGEILDGRSRGIPILPDVATAVNVAQEAGQSLTQLVIGLTPDSGLLGAATREAVKEAIGAGLNVDSGLHEFLSEDAELASLAAERGVRIRDIRKPRPRSELHFFGGKIEEVESLTIAVLGTDSAAGKRTTAWLLVDALNDAGYSAELIGTGQTAWMQGARYSIVLDSLVNDFVSGEIEHAVWSAWRERHPQVIVLEGQGSLLNPTYPGGLELLVAGRPSLVILQHVPARREYEGCPGYPVHSLEQQIRAIESLSSAPVTAVTVNHEGLRRDELPAACEAITRATGLPALDVLLDGAGGLVEILEPFRKV